MIINQYDEIISMGTQCNPGLTLQILNIKKETYPFDWVRSNSKIIYDVIKNGKDLYINFNSDKSNDYYTADLDRIEFLDIPKTHINGYGQYFTHYTGISQKDLIDTYSRYCDRLYQLLETNKKVLFIHSHEEYIYHKKSRDDKDIFYNYLCKINDLLIEKYPKLEFNILNLDINNNHLNYGNIINLNINYNLKLSDNSETHKGEYYQPYRDEMTNVIKKYLNTSI